MTLLASLYMFRSDVAKSFKKNSAVAIGHSVEPGNQGLMSLVDKGPNYTFMGFISKTAGKLEPYQLIQTFNINQKYRWPL